MTESDLQEFCDSALKRGDIEAAFNACDNYISANPLSAKGFRKRAGLHAKENEFEKAIKDIDEAIRIRPDESSYYFFRGWWKVELGDFIGAETDQTSAIKLEDEYSLSSVRESAYFFRAVALLHLGRYEEALSDCKNIRDDFLIYLNRLGKVTKAGIVSEANGHR